MITQATFDWVDNRTVAPRIFHWGLLVKHGTDPDLSYKIKAYFGSFYALFRKQEPLIIMWQNKIIKN